MKCCEYGTTTLSIVTLSIVTLSILNSVTLIATLSIMALDPECF
jgi:hypothetical protein